MNDELKLPIRKCGLLEGEICISEQEFEANMIYLAELRMKAGIPSGSMDYANVLDYRKGKKH